MTATTETAGKAWLTEHGFREDNQGHYVRGRVEVYFGWRGWRAAVAGWDINGETPAEAIANAAEEAEKSYIEHLRDVKEARGFLRSPR